jgi:hypothetical protein
MRHRLKVIPKSTIESVIQTTYSVDVEEFRARDSLAPVDPLLPQYTFNPLTDRPFIHMLDGRYLAPLPELITRKLSPIELYYAGVERFGEPFSRDMGELFEDYIGRQFATLPGSTVVSEIEYGSKKERTKSVDWFVTTGSNLLLVEAKASRFTLSTRIGGDNLETQLKGTVGKAFSQINRTHQALVDGKLGDTVPPGLRSIGLVATLDSAYGMNNVWVRELLPIADIPIVVASASEIEMLVAIGQRQDIGPILEAIIDGDLATWNLGIALQGHYEPTDQNPLHEASWVKYPWN